MKERTIGSILIVLISIPVIWLGNAVFGFACGILACLAFKELVDLKEHHKKIPHTVFFLSIVVLMLFLITSMQQDFLFLELNVKCAALAFLTLFLPCIFYKEENYSAHEAMYLFGSILFLALFFNSLIFIRNMDVWVLVYLVFIAIFTDSFAYLIGSRIGKHKCSPTISPNKTWEGCIGGSIMGVVIASLFYLFKIGNIGIVKIILVSAVLSMIGQFGDLVFSKIKRENKIKDFSRIIPGHGGILDRLDSLIFIVIGYILLIGIL